MASLLPTTFVYAEKADDLAKLIAFARGLGEKVNVLFIGELLHLMHCPQWQ